MERPMVFKGGYGGIMPPVGEAEDKTGKVCQWLSQADVLKHFATYNGPTQSQQHIKPLHWYVACRLVLEGGFQPEEITPRPPFAIIKRRSELFLSYDPALATGGEATLLGGLKT